MTYTVWSRGELIGTSDLDFLSLGFEQCRSGHFLPNARGLELMDDLASDSHCMRAFMHRNYRDPDGKSILDPAYVGSDWFGDIAAHLHETEAFALELRDAFSTVVPTTAIGIQDKEPYCSLPQFDGGGAPREPLPPCEEALLREKLEAQLTREAMEEQDDIAFTEMFRTPGNELQDIPLDLTRPVGWGYAEEQGDNELGSGWNATLRDIPSFPRYQLHVILAPAVG